MDKNKGQTVLRFIFEFLKCPTFMKNRNFLKKF